MLLNDVLPSPEQISVCKDLYQMTDWSMVVSFAKWHLPLRSMVYELLLTQSCKLLFILISQNITHDN